MGVARKIPRRQLFADKKELQKVMAEQNALMGFVRDPTATAEQARASILADGVKPEENLFSRGIVEARDKERGYQMATAPKTAVRALLADKAALIKILEQQDARTGFVPDPTATPQKAREMMIANGIRPEDNEFSREIIRMREEE